MTRFCALGLLALLSLFASVGADAKVPPERTGGKEPPPPPTEKAASPATPFTLPPKSDGEAGTAASSFVPPKQANLQDQGFDQLISSLTDVRTKKAELDKQEKELIAALQAKQK